MGCDIHLYTERKITIDNKEKWFCCDHFKFNPYYDKDNPDDGEQEYEFISIYDERNYEAFSVLADVRNYYNIKPLDEPRGLPEDVSDIVRKESHRWGTDGHSHSWFTARELFVYKSTNPYKKHTGMVSSEQMKRYDKCGIAPNEWCRWTNNKDYEFMSWKTPGSYLDRLVEAVKKKMEEEFWIWDSLSEEEKKKRLIENMDNFRIVFWFDN